MDVAVVLQSMAYLGVLGLVVYMTLRGQRGGTASLPLKVAAASGVLMVASLIALVASGATEGSVSSALMLVFWVSLAASTVLLFVALCIPGGT